MKKRILSIFVFATALLWAGCSKSDEDNPEPTPEPVDTYVTFKADATPRWESGATTLKNEDGSYIFIIDNGSNILESTRYKTGRMSSDGSSYEFIEFSGTPSVGSPSGAIIRTQSGTLTPHSLEIVKAEGGKLWIVYKETANAPEKRVVQ